MFNFHPNLINSTQKLSDAMVRELRTFSVVELLKYDNYRTLR